MVLDPSFLQSVNTSIIPRDDNAYDIGNENYRWRDAYINRYTYVRYLLSHDRVFQIGTTNNLLGFMPILTPNLAGFNPPYRVEMYNPSTDTWDDVTGSYTWAYLTDLKATEVAITTTAGEVKKLRLYFDLKGNYKFVTAVVMHARWINEISYIKVESSSTSDFTSDVSTRLEWSGSLGSWDNITFWHLESDTGKHRYLRITIHIKRNSDGQMRLREIMLLSRSDYSQVMEGYLPFNWDYTRAITFYNKVVPASNNAYDLGEGSLKWRNIHGVNVYGDTIYEGGIALADKYALKSHTHTRDEITDFWNTPFWDNIPDKPSEYPPEAHTHTIDDITDIENASVAYADSAGNADTVDGKHASDFALATHTHALNDLDDVEITNPSSGEVLTYDGTKWVNSTVTPGAHTHDASDIVSGRFPLDRMPDGTKGYVLEAQGSGANPKWVNPNYRYYPKIHASRHKPGGADALFPADYDIVLKEGYKLGFQYTFGTVVNTAYLYMKRTSVLGTEVAFEPGALWIDGYCIIDANRKLRGLASIKQTLIPDADNEYDLGSDTAKWANIRAYNIYASKLLDANDISAKRILTRSFHFITYFTDLDSNRWGKEIFGSASYSLDKNVLTLQTGTTSNSGIDIYINFQYAPYNLYNKMWRRFRVCILFNNDTNQEIYIGATGIYTSSVTGVINWTSRHFGIKVINNKVYGTVGNGSAESTLEIATINAPQYLVIEAELKPGDGAYYWVNGEYKGKITTNLPTKDDFYCPCEIILRNTAGENKSIQLSMFESWVFDSLIG